MREDKINQIVKNHDPNFKQEESLSSSKGNLLQIDILKAIMIFLVIFDHFVAWNIKREIGVSFWERIAIPVFLVIMGFNMGRSFQRDGISTLKELYSWKYFKKKILRYLVPFFILYLASTFIGLFIYDFDFEAMYYGQFYPEHGPINYFIGILPFWGPGNWFIPVIFGSILVIPLLYWLFTKNKVIALIACFVIEFIMQMIIYIFIGEITTWEEYHILHILTYNILFLLSGVGLGLWFSFGYKLTAKRNVFMWILLSISLFYIIGYQFFGFRLEIDGNHLLIGDYHFLFIPYSAFLVLVGLQFLPIRSELRISKAISLISRATYHILLTQILGYGMITAWWGTHYGMDLPFDPFDILELIIIWIVFISFGILWYKIDHQRNLLRRVLYYFNFFIVFSSILFFSFWIQSLWVPIPLIIIIFYAITALVTHYIIKKPITSKLLVIWTSFLLITFISMIFQIELTSPNLDLFLNTLLIILLIFNVIYSFYQKK
jgi:peptidoglycan/LPS O-acetylase OafA/YrhL